MRRLRTSPESDSEDDTKQVKGKEAYKVRAQHRKWCVQVLGGAAGGVRVRERVETYSPQRHPNYIPTTSQLHPSAGDAQKRGSQLEHVKGVGMLTAYESQELEICARLFCCLGVSAAAVLLCVHFL